MAALELRNKKYRVVFMYAGHKYAYSLDTNDREIAEALRGGVEKTMMLVQQKALRVPDGVDIVAFVRNGGKVEEPTTPPSERVSFATFKQKYLDAHQNGALEVNSLSTVAMHLRHFDRSLGARFLLQDLTLADLQQHVNTRSQKKYRGKKLSPVTLKKEMASFRAAWNWAAHTGLVKGTFPSRGLVYPKADEKPPYMTWQEIERRIAPAMKAADKAELWECLYLTQPEIAALLEHVRDRAAHDWIYPTFSFVAHTGARRSEILRVLVSDVDFEAMTVLLREKKRSRKQRTTRRVPLTPFLAGVLRAWLEEHPGGQALFCHKDEVFRSKKRSRTTGHQSAEGRESSLKGRRASVQRRTNRPGLGALTKDELHDHFKRTLAGSKWAVVPGWHCFRHSFISLCASKGVDQRLIDEWVGHQTEEQRKRYRHLLPSTQQQAIRSVFGEA